jgi:histidinol-phosphate aminotransferase
VTLTAEQKKDFVQRGFTRRSFGRLATMLTAASTMPFYNEFALAQDVDSRRLPAGAVKIDNNEYPTGPCKEAVQAMQDIVPKGNRYMFFMPRDLQTMLAQQEGLKPNYVQAHMGSSPALCQAVLSFTSPTKSLVTADPGYEAGPQTAKFIGAKVISVPLTKDYAHDVRAMASADPNAGLIYVCNPNNPTGTLTSRADLEYLMANKPSGSVVLLDEAYIHFAGIPSAVDMVAADKDIIILRTFSKIYGMAGLRAGVAMGRPDLLAKTRGQGINWLPVTSMAGAMASLQNKDVVAERRKINKDTREDVFSFLDKKGIHYVPSVSNKFMLDVNRPGREVIDALRKENVFVGRVWPSWPTYVRVSIGSPEEMGKFKAALIKVMA